MRARAPPPAPARARISGFFPRSKWRRLRPPRSLPRPVLQSPTHPFSSIFHSPSSQPCCSSSAVCARRRAAAAGSPPPSLRARAARATARARRAPPHSTLGRAATSSTRKWPTRKTLAGPFTSTLPIPQTTSCGGSPRRRAPPRGCAGPPRAAATRRALARARSFGRQWASLAPARPPQRCLWRTRLTTA